MNTTLLHNKPLYVTSAGFKKIRKEHELLNEKIAAKKKEQNPKLVDISSMDAEYIAFWEDISFLENRLNEVKYFLKKAILIKKPANKEVVSLGATVVLETPNNQKEELTIVGTPEVNLSAGYISNESPVGRSLLGCKLHEEIMVNNYSYKIKGIRYNNHLLS